MNERNLRLQRQLAHSLKVLPVIALIAAFDHLPVMVPAQQCRLNLVDIPGNALLIGRAIPLRVARIVRQEVYVRQMLPVLLEEVLIDCSQPGKPLNSRLIGNKVA